MGRSHQDGARIRCGAAAAARKDRARGIVHQAMLTLAAITLWVLLFAAFAAIGGCTAQTKQVGCSHSGGRCGHGHWLAERPRSSLIFTAEPGLTPISAEEISRADWPTTGGRTSYGQTVNYQEYRYDTQGLGPYDINYGYRTFTFSRNGTQGGE